MLPNANLVVEAIKRTAGSAIEFADLRGYKLKKSAIDGAINTSRRQDFGSEASTSSKISRLDSAGTSG
jgi:hypothetical protein